MKISIDNGLLEYIPAFLSPQNSAFLFDLLLEETPWNQGTITIFGKKIATPRREAFYAEHGLNYAYSGQQLTVHPFTKGSPSFECNMFPSIIVKPDFNAGGEYGEIFDTLSILSM